MLRPPETAHQRLARMFSMGKFGEELAQEILTQYLDEYLLENNLTLIDKDVYIDMQFSEGIY